MHQDCDYHPGDPARWSCGDCQLSYCQRCMPDADTRSRSGNCPHCGNRLAFLGSGQVITPFWERIDRFFRYPLARAPLQVIAICTFVPLAIRPDAGSLLNRYNLFALVVTLVLTLALMKYTYAVLQRTAEGNMQPPPLAEAFTGSGFDVAVLQLIVFVILSALVSTGAMLFGPVGLVLTLVMVVLGLPASIMILAMERSVPSAVNPLQVASLISRIGWPYLVFYGYLLLMFMAMAAAQELALAKFPPMLAQPLSGFLGSSFMLILFHMMGYLLYQYQRELGFVSTEDDPDPDAAQRKPDDRSARVDADIDMRLKDGRYREVHSLLQAALKREPHNGKRIDQWFKWLKARDDGEQILRDQTPLLERLARTGRGRELAELMDYLKRLDDNFALTSPGLIVACARTLHRSGDHVRALSLLRDFHKRFPGDEEIAPAYLLAAQILANALHKPDRARSMIEYVAKRCGAHPLSANTDEYLRQIDANELLVIEKASFGVGGHNQEQTRT